MLILLLKNWKAVLLSLVTASVIGGIAYLAGHFIGYGEGKQAAIDASTAATLPIRNDQNEVRNYRPDDARLFDGMLHGKF